ncbi:MAG: PQQ-binding-like beta-propeller repeat protein [Planctomycetota bacterium]
MTCRLARPLFARCVALSLAISSAAAEDWPVYRHDEDRTGATNAVAGVARLRHAWTYRSPVPPQSAWDATARQDAYHGIRWLPERRLYDAAFEPIAVGRTIYFGSTSDDALHAVDLETGRPRWLRTVGGPIRVAPAHHGGRIFFGSDDGHAYCLDAVSGGEVWRFSADTPIRLVLQDGRFVSPLACRTGVVVRQAEAGAATAYFGQSLLPWEDSLLCAVDAETGVPSGAGRYVRRVSREGHLDGPMAATDQLLYCPRGNTAALRYTLGEAAPLGNIWAATGGCFSLFFPDEHRMLAGGFAYQGKAALLDAPTSGPSGPETVKYLLGVATAAYREGVLYLQYPDRIQAVRRSSGESLWATAIDAACCVTAAGDALFVGAEDRILALALDTGAILWESPMHGRVHSVIVVDEAVCASTDRGELSCFRPTGRATPPADVMSVTPPVVEVNPHAPRETIDLAVGPALRFLDARRAEITWQTNSPSETILMFGPRDRPQAIREPGLRTEHRVVVSGLVLRREYPYRICTSGTGDLQESREFTCDTYLNYNVPKPWDGEGFGAETGDPAVHQAAQRVLGLSALRRGLCLVLGASDEGALAAQIARETDARILVVDTSVERIEAARRAIQATGNYGSRIAALVVESLEHLPLPSHCFRLIASADALALGTCNGSAVEVKRLLDPVRGVAVIGQPPGRSRALSVADVQGWLAPVTNRAAGASRLTIDAVDDDSGRWAALRAGGGLPGARPWTHQYADVGNTACSDDTLQGATGFRHMTTQWIGRPGGRYQADRMVRKPAPLAAAGRLVLQGQGSLICVDTASGTVLWSLEIPGLGRFNMVRDASNYCTDGEHVYLAFEGACWVIDLDEGRVVRRLEIGLPADRPRQDWSYVATSDHALLGTWTSPGAAFTNAWGGGAWYEHSGWEKACSSGVFAYDTRSFEKAWAHEGGVVINTTITVGDGRVYFLETRQPEVVAGETRLLNGKALWSKPWLVALDLQTGRKVWERTFADEEFPYADVMCGMVFRCGMLLFHGSTPSTTRSGPKGFYHLRAFDAASGADAWKSDAPWAGYGHGIQTSYPVVVRDKVFYSPHVFQLATGDRLPFTWNEGHCGTTSASCHALFYRFTTIAFWDIEHRTETRWPTVRPDCWLSAIPAEGLLLAPEGGGGCVCGGWLETSAALAPRTDFAVFRTRRRHFVGSLQVDLEPPVGGGIVRVTTDGSEPSEQSPVYDGPIQVIETTTVRARVYGGDDARLGGPVVARRFEKLTPKRVPTRGRVEFQPATLRAAESDDTIDCGEPVRIRDDGSVYGWLDEGFDGFWAVDAAERVDPVRDSLVWVRPGMCWQMAVPDGDYDVTLMVGNPAGETKHAETGTVFVGAQPFALARDLTSGEMAEITHRVVVADGVLELRKPTDDQTTIGVAWMRFSRVE